MVQDISRRTAIKSAAVLTGLAALGIPSWMSRALAESEEVVPCGLTSPTAFDPAAPTGAHGLDTRTLDKSSFITPVDTFFGVQHYGPTQVDLATCCCAWAVSSTNRWN